MIKLFVNVDHVATVREARKTFEPSPLTAAILAEKAGAYGITAHLREDRRHMQDDDIKILKDQINTPLNLEMAAVDEMIQKLVPPTSTSPYILLGVKTVCVMVLYFIINNFYLSRK